VDRGYNGVGAAPNGDGAAEAAMTQLEEFESVPAGPRRPGGPKLLPIALVAVAIVLAGLIWFFWLRDRTGGEPPPPAEPMPAAAVETAEPEPELELPPLDASDALVREMVAGVSGNPVLASWLVNEELVRRFVAAAVSVAAGDVPASQLRFMAPAEGFRERRSGARVVLDPESYDRFDRMVGAFLSLDTAGSAELFERIEPLAQEAYRDLGYPDGDFREVLGKAIRHLLRTPRVSGAIELVPKVESFEFADSDLEALSDAQKQLVRIGPDNTARIQAKLRELGLALGFSPEQLR